MKRFSAVLLATVCARARALPPGVWIRGDGLDEVRLGRLPTARELDAAAPGNPVRLQHRSLHASVLNGRAIQLLRSIAGMERRGRVPTGLVAGREEAVGRIVGGLPVAELVRGLVLAGRELAGLGLTTVADATPHTWDDLLPLREAMDGERFALRVGLSAQRDLALFRGHGF